jgi:dTDP-4-dehydrorhamnose reductase
MTVLIPGAAGQLGQAMVRRLSVDHQVIGLTHRELDITRLDTVMAAVTSQRPDAIVNCASYNDVNRAEVEPVRALEANAWGPWNLARAAAAVEATLVHFSTDFVFDGEASAPYAEADAPRPQGRYAVSKLLGEWLATEAPRAYILRVESLFGGPRAKSSVDMLLTAVRSGQAARPFSDRVTSPSYVEDVTEATSRLLQTAPPPGLYHCVNSGMTTWLDLTRELARLAGHPDARIEPLRLADANLVPPRPRFAALSNAKLASVGIEMPAWEDALRRYVTVKKDMKDMKIAWERSFPNNSS